MEDYNSLSTAMSSTIEQQDEATSVVSEQQPHQQKQPQSQRRSLNILAENIMMCHKIEALACADTVEEIIPKNRVSRYLRSRYDPHSEFDEDEYYEDEDATLNTYGDTLHTSGDTLNTFDTTLNTLTSTENENENENDSSNITLDSHTFDNTLGNSTFDHTLDSTLDNNTFDNDHTLDSHNYNGERDETSTECGLLFNDDGTVEIPVVPQISSNASGNASSGNASNETGGVIALAAHRGGSGLRPIAAPIALPELDAALAAAHRRSGTGSTNRDSSSSQSPSPSQSPSQSLSSPSTLLPIASGATATALNRSMESAASRLVFAPYTVEDREPVEHELGLGLGLEHVPFDESPPTPTPTQERKGSSGSHTARAPGHTSALTVTPNANATNKTKAKPTTGSSRRVDTSMASEDSIEVVGRAVKRKKKKPQTTVTVTEEEKQKQKQHLNQIQNQNQNQKQKSNQKQKQKEKTKPFRLWGRGRNKGSKSSSSNEAKAVASASTSAIPPNQKRYKDMNSILVKEPPTGTKKGNSSRQSSKENRATVPTWKKTFMRSPSFSTKK